MFPPDQQPHRVTPGRAHSMTDQRIDTGNGGDEFSWGEAGVSTQSRRTVDHVNATPDM